MVSRGENADQYKNRIGFYQVRRDHNAHLVDYVQKNCLFGLRAEILLSWYQGGQDSRAELFLGYVKKYWFFGEIFTSANLPNI